MGRINKPGLTLYRTHSPEMQSCDLIEWQSYGSLLGWGIRKITKKKRNHSSILLRPREYGGLVKRRFLLEAMGGGLVPRMLSMRLSQFKGKVYWSSLECNEDRRNHMIEWALLETVAGKRYDYGSLFKNIMGRVSVNAESWFCSEVYTAMCIEGGLLPIGTKAFRPGEFEGLHSQEVLIYDSNYIDDMEDGR